MSKQFVGLIVAIILVFVGIFIFTGKKTDDGSKSSGKTTPTSHIIGSGKTGVTLIEYGDYQCPYCLQYYPIIKEVQAKYNDQIKFQFRNFPLVSIHPNAFAAARAAEAAGLQNKFWEMNSLLYENQDQWAKGSDPNSFFKQYASRLGLNAAQFTKDFASSKVNNLINADIAEGTKLKVDGTPAFILNGKKIQIGQSVAAFEQVINAEIAKKAPAPAATEPAPAQ